MGFILAASTSKAHPDVLFRYIVKTVMDSWTSQSLLHLKIVAYHDDSVREGATLQLELFESKQVLIPRHWQWFLNKLDPRGDLPVTELRDLL